VEKRFLIKDCECKWNSWITWLRSYQGEHWYAPICDSIQAEDNAFRIAAAVEEKRIVSLLSVGAPFWIHDTAARVCSTIRKQKLTWVPINFDPYAYIEFISSEERRRRIRQEKKTFKNAHRILMLSQSKEDYRRNPMLPKMDFFEIPNIRRLSSDYPNEHVKFDEKCIDCVCIGNLYWIVRRPDSLFSMFEKFSDSRIRLHVVGALIQGFPEGYIEYWKQRLGDRFFYHGRVCQEEAVSIMKSADILVNIGNTTSNQCPSKVLEYISTGKPIVSISKIEHCTSKVYLDRYPLACQINESDSERQGQIDQVEAFVREKYRQQIPFGEIASIFSDCTNEKAVETVLDAFK
jgi:glycosyltransferase involved in cell wall biosynthesis